MFELTINNKVCQFNFGMGFLREINKTVIVDVDGIKGKKENVGLRYKLGQLQACNSEVLVEFLYLANAGYDPRVNYSELDNFIDNECADIDDLYKKVWDFLETANATKKIVAAWKADVAKEEAKAAATA
jgi:hypothetical protein